MPENTADKATFKNKYLNKGTVTLVLVGILLFIGIIMFLQFCLTPSLDSNPSGCAQSSADASGDGTTVDPACIGCGQGFALLIIVISVIVLTYVLVKKSDAGKLADTGEYMASVEIYGNSTAKTEADNIFSLQASEFLEKASEKGIVISNAGEEPEEEEEDEEEEYEEEE